MRCGERKVRKRDFVTKLTSLASLLPRLTRQPGHQAVERLPPALTEADVLELLYSGAKTEMSVNWS